MVEKTIVLCATQRCGSTMVCEDMRNAGVLGLPEEYFIPWTADKGIKDWPKRYRAMRRNRSRDGVFAVKVMANQLMPIEECLAASDYGEASKGRLFARFHELMGDADWIFIRRDDTVRQAISRVMALQTSVNHATARSDDQHFAGKLMKGYRSSYNAGTRFEHRAIGQQLRRIGLENAVWSRFFSDWKIKPHTVVYETAAPDPNAYMGALGKHCGIALADEIPPRKMVKLSNKRNDNWYMAFTSQVARRLHKI